MNKYYKERIFLKQNTRAFSILLHTIRIDSQIISIVRNAVNHAIKLLSDKVLLMDKKQTIH